MNMFMASVNLYPYVFYGAWLLMSGLLLTFFIKENKAKIEEVKH